ncbi:MAG TPA: nucleotide exchange factor GrpE [Candidatus Eisenbacteria bacterium]|jgi:molecular chaperone GrpE|nr:nucleotide exchange factor GrpE [Candidatus Eisenbacteria bacterium]
MKRKNEAEESVAPEGVEPAGDLGPETSVDAAEGSSLITELERLRGREDELLRALAEQQNVVRRRRQEMESSVQFAQESLVKDLLPVLDDFERALKAMDGAVSDSMRAGVALVYDRLVRILTAQGLEPIRPLGEPFDPTLHDAIAQDPAPDHAPGTVVEVAQPGYRFKSRVLRHAKVVVAGSAEPTESSEGGI